MININFKKPDDHLKYFKNTEVAKLMLKNKIEDSDLFQLTKPMGYFNPHIIHFKQNGENQKIELFFPLCFSYFMENGDSYEVSSIKDLNFNPYNLKDKQSLETNVNLKTVRLRGISFNDKSYEQLKDNEVSLSILIPNNRIHLKRTYFEDFVKKIVKEAQGKVTITKENPGKYNNLIADFGTISKTTNRVDTVFPNSGVKSIYNINLKVSDFPNLLAYKYAVFTIRALYEKRGSLANALLYPFLDKIISLKLGILNIMTITQNNIAPTPRYGLQGHISKNINGGMSLLYMDKKNLFSNSFRPIEYADISEYNDSFFAENVDIGKMSTENPDKIKEEHSIKKLPQTTLIDNYTSLILNEYIKFINKHPRLHEYFISE